jgi:hypothetical protein
MAFVAACALAFSILRPHTTIQEETAIWDVRKMVKAVHPGINLDGLQVKTQKMPPARDGNKYNYRVIFTDPKTGRTHAWTHDFSDESVEQYKKAHEQ